MSNELNNQIVIYEDTNGDIKLETRLEDETIWLNQEQMSKLFGRDRTVVSRHIGNIFKDKELEENVVCANFAHTTKHGAIENKTQQKDVKYYNLDVVISVGYRVKSLNGVKFRQWATKILKDFIVKGYAVNEKRLQQKGLKELNETISLLKSTISDTQIELSEAKGLLDVILNYSRTWTLLQGYDEDSLKIDFIPILSKNNMLYKSNGELKINDNALVALSLMTAKSEPKQKETIINLIVNILQG